MKMTVNVECTPEEARRFVGLPDVTPLNEMLVREMTNRAEENMKMMSPDVMIKSWMSFGGQAQRALLHLQAWQQVLAQRAPRPRPSRPQAAPQHHLVCRHGQPAI